MVLQVSLNGNVQMLNCLMYIFPFSGQVIIIFSCFQLAEPTYGDYEYPHWAIGIGWILALCSIVPIPIVAVYMVARESGSLWQVSYSPIYKVAREFGWY